MQGSVASLRYALPIPPPVYWARPVKRIIITQGLVDLKHDHSVGFELISTDDIDDFGIPEIIKRIRNRVGDSPIYLSFDIDVIGAYSYPSSGCCSTYPTYAEIVQTLVSLQQVSLPSLSS